ncbi:MAG: hypothetical protein IJA97_05470 [Clostridia bacterium]|nr:hypothetical protein [Clostridia bacterium]
MFLIKIAFGALCVYTSIKIAKTKAMAFKEEYYFWESVVLSCDVLISDLSYKKSEVNASLNVDYPSESYAKIVASFIKGEEMLFPKFISQDDKIKLENFFSTIGASNSNTQKTAIISQKTDFLKCREISKNKFDKNYSAIIKVGFAVGIMLLILVI